ncbi:MAG: cell division protein SepF [Candidatus Aenigmarchaeota archaeon]|nr:cell division protein SepF [Candidatus Aenigmarchaeota archaeon]
MVDLKKMFGLGSTVEEGDFIELDTTNVETPSGKVPIKIDKLDSFQDTDRIQKAFRELSIVLVKIKSLREKDLSELKRAIEKLRKTCLAMNGDIVGIDEDYILLVPSYGHLVRD